MAGEVRAHEALSFAEGRYKTISGAYAKARQISPGAMEEAESQITLLLALS